MHPAKKHFMRLLIGCLLLCCVSSAQITYPVKDSSIIKTIDLPVVEPLDTSRSWERVSSPYVYIISDKDLYDHFGYETTMKFREFNFADYHILGEKKNKEWVWVMRENKRAFTEIPATTSPGYADKALFKSHSPLLIDTLVRSATSSVKSNWYTTGHGDCLARFEYKLYTDKYHPVLLLKQWNYSGGCRAGGSKSYTLSFSMPAGILYTSKNTILAKDRRDSR